MKSSLVLLCATLVLIALTGCPSSTGPTRRNYSHVVVQPPAGTDDIATVPPPFTAAETTALRSGFDWNETTFLLEEDENGNPALYYTLLLVKDRETWEFLQLTGFAIDPYPLFPQELARWDGLTGYMDPVGDAEGTFVFGLIPGAFYNWLRGQALSNNPVVEVVRLREPPDSFGILPGGSLSYQYLADLGFTGVSSSANDILGPESSVAGAVSPLTHPKLRWLRRLASFFRDVANLVRTGIALVRIAVGKDREFRIALRIMNTDPSFVQGPAPDVEDDINLVQSAWRRTQDGMDHVTLEGAIVDVGKNAWARSVSIDSNNTAQVTIPASGSLRVWLRLTTPAAEILREFGVFNRRIMLDPTASLSSSGDRDDDVNWVVTLRAPDVNMLAQFNDSRDYMRSVVGVVPPRAVVPHLPAHRPSFTGCLSFIRPELITATALSGIFTAGLSTLGVLAIPDWDIFMQGDDPAGRLIPTHEFGHFASCTLLQRTSHVALLSGMKDAFSSLIADGHQTNAPARALTEGFADFFSSQVTGGSNYFMLSANSGRQDSNRPAFFCDQRLSENTGTPCFEDNVQGPIDQVRATQLWAEDPTNYPDSQVVAPATMGDALGVSVGWVVTLMTDAFDGNEDVRLVRPNFGVHWIWGAGTPFLLPSPTLDAPSRIANLGDHQFGGLPDEMVVLPGRAFPQLFDTWWRHTSGTLDSYTPMFDALAMVSNQNGHSRDAVCRMFELHSLSGRCEDLAPSLGTTRPSAYGTVLSPVWVPISAPYDPHLAAYRLDWFAVGNPISTFKVELIGPGGVVHETLEIPHARVPSWLPNKTFNCLSDFAPLWTARITPHNGLDFGTPVDFVLPLPFCIE